MRSKFVTYAIALLGVLVFWFFHLPLPWLLGPIFALLLAALLRVNLSAFKPLGNLMRTILGVAVGATVTTTLIHEMLRIWPSLVLVVCMVAVIGVMGVWYFHKFCKYDLVTSYYGAMPGGLQDMLIFGEEAGANVRTLSLIHATRVLVIVASLPFLMHLIWNVDLSNPPGKPIETLALEQLLWMGFAGVVGWQVAKALGLFGASILGPLILASALSLLGVLHERPPAEAIYLAQYFIGVSIGVKYVNVTLDELRKDVLSAFGYTLVLGLITLVFFGIIEALHIAPPMDALLAFTPGGQAEMAVLALIVGADMSYVISHHLLRIFVVIIGAPLVARLQKKGSPQD